MTVSTNIHYHLTPTALKQMDPSPCTQKKLRDRRIQLQSEEFQSNIDELTKYLQEKISKQKQIILTHNTIIRDLRDALNAMPERQTDININLATKVLFKIFSSQIEREYDALNALKFLLTKVQT